MKKRTVMQTVKLILFIILCLPVLAVLNGESPDGDFNPVVNLLGMLYSYIVFGVIKIQDKLI